MVSATSKTTSKRGATLAMIAIILTSLLISFGATSDSSLVYPGADWKRWKTPEDAGYSAAKFEQVAAHLDKLTSTGLVVSVGGKIVYERGNIANTTYIASVRKSVLAMLYGNYVEDGTIDLNKTISDLGMTDIGGLSDQEKEATIADLLGARSGVYHPASNGGDNLADAPPRNSQKHGEYFLYNNWDFNALGAIFEQLTGKGIYDALETDLVNKIGMQDFDKTTHKKSGNLEISVNPAYHMNLSARDLNRIGLVMLRGGKWKDEQIVPEEWTKKISSLITPLEEMNPERYKSKNLGYGYLWWILDGPQATGPFVGAYTGIGMGGQFLTVIPALDMVVTHKNDRRANGGSLGRTDYFRLLQLIFNAKLDN